MISRQTGVKYCNFYTSTYIQLHSKLITLKYVTDNCGYWLHRAIYSKPCPFLRRSQLVDQQRMRITASIRFHCWFHVEQPDVTILIYKTGSRGKLVIHIQLKTTAKLLCGTDSYINRRTTFNVIYVPNVSTDNNNTCLVALYP